MKRNKLRQFVYGFAIGDALGVPFEFNRVGSFTFNGQMNGYGTHNQHPGTFSDDTQLLLATLKAAKNGCRVEGFLSEYLRWLSGDYGQVFDIGNATRVSLLNYKQKGHNDLSAVEIEATNGNGAMMRIAPLAFYEYSETEIRKICELTHLGEKSTEYSLKYVGLIKSVLVGAFDKNKIEVGFIGSNSGYAPDSFNIVLKCIKETNDYTSAVSKAINMGGDTDTHAALVGGVTAILYDGFPNKFLNKLRGRDLIEQISD